MKRFDVACLIVVLFAGAASAAEGQESLTDWQWYQEVRLQRPATGATHFDFILPPAVFGNAREDLRDLRLYDNAGKEVEYALRTLRTRNEQVVLEAKTYNQVKGPNRTAEVRLDLGIGPLEHNAVEIDTAGQNVRRRFRVEGSDSDGDWRELATGWFIRYEYGGQRIDVHRHRYATSRFRYLRLTLEPDPTVDGDAPEITAARVYRWISVPGEDVTLSAGLSAREAVPGDGGPGSAWLIDLGGNTPPVERLSFDVSDPEFARPFRLEALSPEGARSYLMGGEWRGRAGAEARPMEVVLPREERPYKLRLVVTDHRNRPLNITAVRYTAAARQVVFPAKADLVGPLKLYYGNPKALETGYDFGRTLPMELKPAPVRLTVGESVTEQPRANPVYRPEPPPLTEQFPWVVYLVLSLACLSLLGILGAMGRIAIARHDAAAPAG